MKIFFHNFNPRSDSGPNKFTRQLFENLSKRNKIQIALNQKEADVEFALISLEREPIRPVLLRLDGIYFNSDQDFKTQNAPIKYSYEKSSHVVFQSNFNKKLTEKWFGKKESSSVILNAPDNSIIESVSTNLWSEHFEEKKEIWSCASSWRPHKRLEENLRYFLEKSPKDAVMIVAGSNADIDIIDKYSQKSGGRVFYVGNLSYLDLISLYKRSNFFLHLAYLDHCPNVVVDAQASGCKVVCSSSGGTSELLTDGVVILENEWDFSPIKLYEPPPLNLSSSKRVFKTNSNPDINKTADMYFERLCGIIKK